LARSAQCYLFSLAGRGGYRKLTPEIGAFATVRFPEIYGRSRASYSQRLRGEIAAVFGVALVHFACGAWYGEWPEFEKIAGRAWFGLNPGPGKQQHDPYGVFRVELVKPEHPLVRGMADFDTQDELYTCLAGDHPVEIVAQAKSKVDGKYYPIALVSHYGKGRTFHCVLGHDVKALSVPGVQELYRRGCAWAAGLAPVAAQAAQPTNK